MPKIKKVDIKTYTPTSQAHWRNWLLANHVIEDAVWIIYNKKGSNKPTVAYTNAVDEALCFGWIDSTSKSIDEFTYKQYFTKRKNNSTWSKVNKDKIERLTAAKLMQPAGLAAIEVAKQNGSWTILDAVEKLIIPDDLQKELSTYINAVQNFNTLSRTDKRNILQWLVMAKRPETRQARIKEIAMLAENGKKPKQF